MEDGMTVTRFRLPDARLDPRLHAVRVAADEVSEARRRLIAAIVECRQPPAIPYQEITAETDVSIATVRTWAIQAGSPSGTPHA